VVQGAGAGIAQRLVLQFVRSSRGVPKGSLNTAPSPLPYCGKKVREAGSPPVLWWVGIVDTASRSLHAVQVSDRFLRGRAFSTQTGRHPHGFPHDP
jgi:hypothetical protein